MAPKDLFINLNLKEDEMYNNALMLQFLGAHLIIIHSSHCYCLLGPKGVEFYVLKRAWIPVPMI